jgi:hypothetical protein
MAEISRKLARWIIFGVLVALVPLAYSYLDLIVKHRPATIEAVANDGGLLLIISAICAGSLGELIGSGNGAIIAKIISSGATIIILL